MTFLDDFSRKYFGASEADAARALRPGGPLDTTVVALKCTACGEEKKEVLRWFQLHDFRCSCGALFDGKPLRHALAQAAVHHMLKTHTPDEITEILDDRKSNNQS